MVFPSRYIPLSKTNRSPSSWGEAGFSTGDPTRTAISSPSLIQYLNEPIPQEARQELNDKILYLVDQDLAEQSGISREDIYNAYTGDGGLHGLKRSDFSNYHEYAEAKKEIENGQFFTPPALCQFIMEALSPAMDETVADLTSGIANFCNFMPLEANFYGCELDIKSHKVAHYLYPAANLEHLSLIHI